MPVDTSREAVEALAYYAESRSLISAPYRDEIADTLRALLAERDALRQADVGVTALLLQQARAERDAAVAREQAALARERTLREALDFYASRDSYNQTGGYARAIDRDLGCRARAALAASAGEAGR